MSSTYQRFGVWRTRDELQAVEDRVVGIRKQLNCIQRQGSKDGRDTDDALRLAEAIEKLAVLGQKCNAEAALDVALRVEILISLLETEIDSVLTS